MERQVREAILANLFPELKRGQIKNIMKKYNNKFKLKERALLILQKKRTELEERTIKAWKVIYCLAVSKIGQDDPFMDMEAECEEIEKEEEERIEKKEEETMEEAPKVELQPAEQVPQLSPPHSTPIEQVEIHDISEVEVLNQNPLTLEEIKVVMDQAKEQNTLLENVILVSTEELAKVTIKDKPTKTISVTLDTVDT